MASLEGYFQKIHSFYAGDKAPIVAHELCGVWNSTLQCMYVIQFHLKFVQIYEMVLCPDSCFIVLSLFALK